MIRAVHILTLLKKQKRLQYVHAFRICKRNMCDEKKLSNKPSNVTNDESQSPSTGTEHNAPKASTSTFSSYTQAINHSIGDIEKVLMARIHESNQRRFRIMFFSTVAFIITFFVIFGESITKKLKSLTTGLALETLEDKSIKIQTQELAMAVVQTVLNDKDVTAHAASFLREAAQTAETQEALLKLTLHVLQHPDSLNELTKLTKQVLAELAEDKEAIENIAVLLGEAFQNPLITSSLSGVVSNLCNEEEVLNAVSDLIAKVTLEPPVAEALQDLLMNSANHVLNDDEIAARSREFVQDVMRDDRLQREGGDAIWNSLYHAVVPGALRVFGFGLVCASVGLGSLMLSPY